MNIFSQYTHKLAKKYHNLSPVTRTWVRRGAVFCVLAIIGVIATTQIFGTTGLSGKVGLGNFVWLDSNKDGRVNGAEGDQGINGVVVNLYSVSAADTNNDGELSASEQASATVIATKTTANDPRPGATNGKPGYYEFNALEPGEYFVNIAATNFATGKPLHMLMNVPVPDGVGDTQDDKANHGKVPEGGTLAANGVISTRIRLQPDTEPSIHSTKKDDDDNHDTDTTIDFGFWHAYTIGNRVWIDKDNSATINEADGVTPGVAGVTVRLLDGSGNTQIATTTTNANGYYLFNNLNAGNYIVEVAASNFGNSAPLKNFLSSVGANEEADPNAGVDSNDNGRDPATSGQAVRSGVITLGPGASEPVGETDLGPDGQGNDDAFANMTVDFGFVGTASWGDTVYHDVDGDATQDAGEPGIPNVTVTLVCAGPDGNLDTAADNTTQTQKTDANGNYLFINLLPRTCKATVTTADVPGATLTTPGSFTHTIVGQTSFLDADFGFVGNGTIGNQLFIDHNVNGRFDAGDVGIEGVTLDLRRDLNGNGQADNNEPILKTATTTANGQYGFTQLITGGTTGIPYVVVVTDTNKKLTALIHVPGNGPADNESKTPAGFGVSLTQANNQRPEADFGYKPNPAAVIPPKFWKHQAVDGKSLIYTLTWINLSTINGISTSFYDVIPSGTGYISDSIKCQAKGSSTTKSCGYNALLNRIEWQGTVGADAGHLTPDTAVNSIVVTFKVELAEATLVVTNQGFGSYSPISETPVPSDWIDTPVLNDPTIYTRSRTDATIQNITGGRLADTGQLVVVSLIAAGTIIVVGVSFVFWSRHRQTHRKDIIV